MLLLFSRTGRLVGLAAPPATTMSAHFPEPLITPDRPAQGNICKSIKSPHWRFISFEYQDTGEAGPLHGACLAKPAANRAVRPFRRQSRTFFALIQSRKSAGSCFGGFISPGWQIMQVRVSRFGLPSVHQGSLGLNMILYRAQRRSAKSDVTRVRIEVIQKT